MPKVKVEYQSVKLAKSLVAQLHALKHPSQSLNGVIQELVNKVELKNG